MPYAQIDGGQLWYEDAGGPNPPVILVHGIAGNSDGWHQQLPAFEDAGLRSITYDLRSSGRSRPAAGEEGSGSIAGDLDALAEQLGLSAFFLVAQAYGAFGALEFALDRPGAVRALVVTNSMGGIADAGFEDVRARIVAETSLADRELGATYRARNPEGTRRFIELDARNDPRPTRQALRKPMTLERLEGMRVPALLVSSDEDILAPPSLMRLMADRIPGCRFEVIAGAGHCAYWEQPEEWNRTVIGFLKDRVQDSSKRIING